MHTHADDEQQRVAGLLAAFCFMLPRQALSTGSGAGATQRTANQNMSPC
jgi:hypothetical protein